MTTTTPRSGDYFAHVVPGLESIAQSELRQEIPDVDLRGILRRFDERTSVLLFGLAGSPEPLCQMRTVEDLFVTLVDHPHIPGTWNGLRTVAAAIAEAQADRAVSVALRMRPRRKGGVTFRVVARTSGKHAFRRVDAQRAVETALRERFPAWKQAEDDAVVEAWVQVVGTRLLIGLRLSTNDLRQRTWRHASLPAALKPTIAAAMVLLSEPRADDVFLDPMCGSGTILIERALADRYRLVLGGDADGAAVAATRENIGPRYKPIEIRQWDARHLHLETGSVDSLVCNLPFGKQIGTQAEMRALYPALLAEWNRVVRSGGRMVLLTSEQHVLRDAVKRQSLLSIRRQIDVLVRGQAATISMIAKEA